MPTITSQWSTLQAQLKDLITKKDYFNEMIPLLLHMHSLLHSSCVYDGNKATYMDEVWNDLDDNQFRTMPTIKDETIAWDIWHITRIEDLTSNILIAGGEQVLNDEWLRRLHTTVKDTGNAMTDEEIIAFSNEVVMEELKNYRNAVGKRTREIIGKLTAEDLSKKINKTQLHRILQEGGVTEHADSIWLLDFWGRKTVAGIILMPITRHQIVHLNDCIKLKEKCKRLAASMRMQIE